MTEEIKANLIHESFLSFFEAFGPNDIYKELFLEVFFEELYGIRTNNIHLLGEERQEGNTTSDNTKGES